MMTVKELKRLLSLLEKVENTTGMGMKLCKNQVTMVLEKVIEIKEARKKQRSL